MPNLDGNPAGPTPGDSVLGVSFLVLNLGTAESQLTNRRVLTAGTNVTFTDNGPGGTLVINATGGGASDHGALTGLADDDHAQYALLAGRGTGQTLIGGVNASNTLSLQSTSNATRGQVRSLDDFHVTRSASGATVAGLVENTSNTASSAATIEARVAGSSAGDPAVLLNVSGQRTYTFKIANATSDRLEIYEDANLRMYAQGQGLCIGGQAVSAVSSFSCLYVTARAAGGDTEMEIQNASSANKAVLYVSQRNATGAITLTAWGTSTSDTIFGSNAANMHGLTSGKQFRIGTTAAETLMFGTNSAESFRVRGGDQRVQWAAACLVANGSGAVTAPGSIGPSAISVQQWLAVYNDGGTLRYVPLYG